MVRIKIKKIRIPIRYLLEEAAIFIREIGIKHLLIDLQSVDRKKMKNYWHTKHFGM
jgi:PP-loop superfamily ATP-utilizing enzyme